MYRKINQYTNPTLERKILEISRNLKDFRTLPLLIHLMQSRNASTRKIAIEAIIEINNPEKVVEYLMTTMSEQHNSLQNNQFIREVKRLLRKLNTPESKTVLDRLDIKA